MLEVLTTVTGSSPAASETTNVSAKHNDVNIEEDTHSNKLVNNSITNTTANKRRQQHNSLRKGLLLSNFDKTMIVEKARFEPTSLIDDIPKIDITPSYPPMNTHIPTTTTMDNIAGANNNITSINSPNDNRQQLQQQQLTDMPAINLEASAISPQQSTHQPVQQQPSNLLTPQQQQQQYQHPMPSHTLSLPLHSKSYAPTTSPSAPAFSATSMMAHQSLPPINMSSQFAHDSSNKKMRHTHGRSECGSAGIARQNNKKLAKKQSKSTLHGNASPAEIFHKNLVDAVSNVEDSDENEHYVYPYGVGNESVTSISASALQRPLSTRSTPALLPQHHQNSKKNSTNTTTSLSATSKGGFFSDFWLRQTFSGHNNNDNTARDDVVDDVDEYGSSDYDYQHNRRPKLRSYVKDHHSSSYYHSQQPQQPQNSSKLSLFNLWRQTATASSKKFYPYYQSSNPSYLKRYQQQHMHYVNHIGGYTSDEEETPLLRVSRRQQKKHYATNKKKKSCQNRLLGKVILALLLFMMTAVMTIIYVAQPLTDITVDMGRVLATDKELIFDLKVQAENWNWWTIHVAEADISVFAFSKIVPSRIITTLNANESEGSVYFNESQVRGVDPAEYLGGLDHFDEPLSILSNHFFPPPEEAITQIRIKSPGADTSGNERWSRMIRYPYGLVVRGVLKYKPIPPFIIGTYPQSVAICNVSQVDPTSGIVSTDPDKTICSTSSPDSANDDDGNKRTILF
ncbi:vacuolar segregation subunit 7-domain-containing protein [Mycotypha africana]|uniref:vacuolar segregation subunit 7-domain-containing protein n=1 Tax=Mycotypha africana TaxID=64632 RepID=UPI002301006F|nr:vacuolar segregation subunit 7-domain-containing protein [Mycotypha africana]KAI8979281.1 vacuolar segregation subunit 7-domain-containing protein [Mycotypha africana]